MAKSARRDRKQRKCLECGQVFYKEEHLARHIRSHTKERPFKCETCGKTYGRHDSLLRHSRTHDHNNRQTVLRDAVSPTLLDNVVASDNITVHNTIRAALDKSQYPPGTSLDQPPPGLPQSHLPTFTSESAVPWPITISETEGNHSHPADRISYALPEYAPQPHSNRNHDEDSMIIATDATTAADHPATDHANGLPASIFNTPTNLDYLDVGLNNYEPAWLLGHDFDMNDLNFSIFSAISDFGPHNFARPPPPDQHQAYAAAETSNLLNASLNLATAQGQQEHQQQQNQNQGSASIVEQKWHTQISSKLPVHMPSAPLSDPTQVDDRYRAGLSHRLQPPVSNTVLPSADFLNLCIKLYFSRFSPVFPLIHAPTFRPSSENALLLLSICSLGALFVGSPSAVSQGRKIFQVLNKAVLASWENYMGRDKRETLSLTQAALVGQTFGLLSGHPQDLCMVEAFAGTVISWVRQGGFFKIKNSLEMVDLNRIDDSRSQSIDEAWKSWAQAEEAVRLILGLYVHDSEFATIFHHEPLLRHTETRLPVSCSEDLFLAPSAVQWHQILSKQTTSTSTNAPSSAEPARQRISLRRSEMFPYASLAGIVASIQEKKALALDNSTIPYFRDLLLAWHQEYMGKSREERNPTGLIVLWHAAFMALYVDFDLLERAIGRDGTAEAVQVSDRVKAWAGSSEARHAVLHSLLVLKHVETLPIGLEPAIHVPKSLFYSAVVTYCYITFGPSPHAPSTPTCEEAIAPELQMSETAGTARDAEGGDRAWPGTFSAVDSSILCNTIDLLRRVGHWGLSRRFASILETVVGDLVSQPSQPG